MASPNDVSMEEIPLGDDERDSIEYKILMAYAQRRLSVRKYGTLLENEANVWKSSSLTKRKVKLAHQSSIDGPTPIAVYQGGKVEQQSKNQPKQKSRAYPGTPFPCDRPKQEVHRIPLSGRFKFTHYEETSQHQTSETADVSHIADKLAKLVTSRPQESPSDVSFRTLDAGSEEDDIDSLPGGSEGKEHEDKIIQEIVSLLRREGDRLDEKIKKDKVLYQHFKEMLSYPFFKKITDSFLEGVVADSTTKPGDQLQCTKVAFTMEVAIRLTAMDNHPMNLVLGFGLKYLREHFKPWIQDRGGWEKALTSLDEEEVE
ncbi:apoptosis facilitator Bcl-2-like protein 14 [Apus apus]|uniref:apoptosis facilitator Bcl-2-like protein 14 n=1 Tax=Apus apus TaxID=8895 RepID=UPI0021F878F2|nr:apoptosis facilitator Bcl-2-like protein 14 [Apus apus]